jgi:hypothetical protein
VRKPLVPSSPSMTEMPTGLTGRGEDRSTDVGRGMGMGISASRGRAVAASSGKSRIMAMSAGIQPAALGAIYA